MKKHKIVWILLLAAFIVPVGLSEIAFAAPPPGWYQKIDGPARWSVSSDGTCVLDKETGLVWEQHPYADQFFPCSWRDAIEYAFKKTVGGRKGWRLPTIEELSSLVDPTQKDPALPKGHPFTLVSQGFYWSANTRNAYNPHEAWGVNFSDGSVTIKNKADVGGDFWYPVWCVRGGHEFDH